LQDEKTLIIQRHDATLAEIDKKFANLEKQRSRDENQLKELQENVDA
jgi:hypothetical protein